MLDTESSSFLAPLYASASSSDCDHNIPSSRLYFANEIALHKERINNEYATKLDIRKQLFNDEIESFSEIGRDLLDGNLSSFRHLDRYYVHPSKYLEYTREYMLNKWINEKKNHIAKSDLIGAHPSCPKWTRNSNIQTHEISFSHNCCTKYGPAHRRTAKETGGFDHVYHYTYDNVSAAFRETNKDIVEYWRGAGYWIWKPWIILNTMLNVANGCDVICYCDSGAWWNNSAIPLFELSTSIKYGVMMFAHTVSGWGESEDSVNLTERLWSKRDAFSILGVDIEEIYDTVIRKATFSCYQTNPDSIHFVSEWLFHAMDRRVISDDENVFMQNIDGFQENRHDQTIMSLLSKKYGIPAFMDVSQYGWNDAKVYGKQVLNWDYPWIIKHTRGKQ